MTKYPGLKRAVGISAAALLALSTTSVTAATKKKAPKKVTTTKPAATTVATAVTTAGTTATTKAAAAGAGSAFGKKSDTVYEGKGGFKLDLSKCPKDWDINQGITATDVKFFTSVPKSGALAFFGAIPDGMNSYFKYINDQGGIAGHKISIDAKDDGYQADRTKANVAEAIAGKKYAGLATVIGSPNNLAIWEDTQKECMPQLINGTGLANWGDVDDHPWTTGMQLDYTSEAALWASWVKKEFPGGAKVAMLTYNNDFGKSYSRGFRASTKGTNISVVKEELHDGTAPNLTNQMTNIDAVLPDVILLQTTGTFCTQAMAEIEKRQIKAKVMMSLTCGGLSNYFKPLIDQGLTGVGTYMIQTGKDPNDEEWKSDPFIKLFHATVKAQGLDDTDSQIGNGWIYGWFLVEIVREASTYEGGINRANLMLAARGITKTNPFTLPGGTNIMNGLKDAYISESGRVVQYKVRDPKILGTMFPQGDIINTEGSLQTYKKSLEG